MQNKKPKKVAEESTEEENLTPESDSVRFLREPRNRGKLIKIIIISVIVLGSFSLIINSYVNLQEKYTQISNANEQLSELKSENVRLKTELEGKVSISNIKDYAENTLGLQELDQSQIEYIEIQKEDAVEISEGEQNIFVKLKHKLDNFIAYLKG